METRTDARRARRASGSIALLMLMSACAPMSPQIFSDDMLTASASIVGSTAHGGPISVSDAKAEALQTMRRYNAAVQEMSGITPRIGAGLIALSALAILKSISHPNGSDIAGIGVVGSAAYLYGNTSVSKPRQLTYLAGSRALACAVAASEPYDVPADTRADWQRRTEQLELKAGFLRATLGQYPDLLSDRSFVIAPRARAPECTSQPRPACTLPATATAEELRRNDAVCAAARADWDQRCTVAPAKTRTEFPHPAVAAAVSQARQELVATEAFGAQAGVLLGKLRSAGLELHWQSRQIQLRVSEEVLKTEPDLASIVAATRGLRASAFTLTGADVFKPTLGRAESGSTLGDSKVRALDALAQQAIKDIAAATRDLRQERLSLANAMTPVNESIRTARATLSQCEVSLPGVTLRVHPDVDEMTLTASATQTFFVSGGTGVASARVASLDGRTTGTIKRMLDDQGQVGFVYTAPAGGTGKNGDSLLFADAPDQARRTIVIRTAGAVGAARTDGQLQPTAEEKGWLGLDAEATDEQLRKAILACQTVLGKPTQPPGVWDDNTRAEVRKKSKCLNIARQG